MARPSPRHYADERGLLLPLVCVQSSEVTEAATSQKTVRTEAGLCNAGFPGSLSDEVQVFFNLWLIN